MVTTVPEPLLELLKADIASFLGGSSCVIQPCKPFPNLRGISEYGGASLRKEDLILQVSLPGQPTTAYMCRREVVPFAPIEVKICNRLIAAVAALYARIEESNFRAHFRTAVLTSAFDMAIVRLLRRGKSSQFGNIQWLLQTFQDLCFTRYEGEPATSALIYTPNVPAFVEAARTLGVHVDQLSSKVRIGPGFFRDPLTYRLVSGASGFYLSTVNRKIHGIGWFDKPSEYDFVDRANGKHLARCLELVDTERPFAIRTTSRSEVQVITKDGNQLLWRNNRWHAFVPQHFVSFLGPVGVKKDLALLLADTAFAMSEARHGTVILIAPKDSKSIQYQLSRGTISHTSVSSDLTNQLAEQSLRNLKDSGRLLGALSSDGMVQITPEGKIVRIGMIVNTDYATPNLHGGGRTSAASAASQAQFGGRVIKISQDGSIELFADGRVAHRFG